MKMRIIGLEKQDGFYLSTYYCLVTTCATLICDINSNHRTIYTIELVCNTTPEFSNIL